MKQRPEGFRGFRLLDLTPTTRCQLRCRYCYNQGKPDFDRHDADMTPELCAAVVEFLREYRAPFEPGKPMGNYLGYTFYGGEPSLVPELIEDVLRRTVKMIRETGQPYKLRTMGASNFVHWSPAFKALFRKWPTLNFNTSIDGPMAQDMQRVFPNGKGSWEQVERTAEWWAAWTRTPSRHARVTVTPDTVRVLAADVEQFYRIGFRNLTHCAAWEVPGWTPELTDTLMKEYETAYGFALESWRRGDGLRLRWMEKAYLGRECLTAACFTGQHCGAGRNMLGVGVTGDLWPCHRFVSNDPNDPKWRNFYFGNVLKGDYDPETQLAWNNVDFVKNFKGDCGNCAARVHCRGGCVYQNYVCTGDIFKPPEGFCRETRMQTEQANKLDWTLMREGNEAWARFQQWAKGGSRGRGPGGNRGGVRMPMMRRKAAGTWTSWTPAATFSGG